MQVQKNRKWQGAVIVIPMLLIALGIGVIPPAAAQQADVSQSIYVDDKGVLRYQKSGQEAAFFGVNYAPPFAHSFRAINRLGKGHKQVIDQDAYHFARLGFDGFRIHIWDTEISDSLGHLVNNEHLDLLDYMLAKFKQRGIKVIITPLTFYDNGYPEPPTETNGFANYISKSDAPEESEHWSVIKRYLKEFISHRNPYTGLTYKEDPNIIATEIVNEPAHDGSQDSVTSYVNMLADHLRSNGWQKPIFYNISQNPSMAEGVMNADIDGTSFQWYPGGLVGGETIQKNYLPYIDEYPISFGDEPAFQQKAQMVYEFSAADFMGSYALPAMARSFREAGFQWATQFAYDPMVMAPYNTDYRTHYLNMAYTPAKAVSMKIASTAFHQLPRGKSYGRYPDNNSFGDFEVSYTKNLSILNADTAFFYTNDTEASPQNSLALKHIAGVGSSPVVSYHGTGVYFLDKVDDGIWRLEVMPDAIHVKDPFATVALDKRLTWIEWKKHTMKIDLPGLGQEFSVNGVNAGNKTNVQASGGSFLVSPGTYLLTESGQNADVIPKDKKMGTYRLNEFVAPKATKDKPIVRHKPPKTVTTGSAAIISAKVAGLHPHDSVRLVVQSGWQPQEIPMQEVEPYKFEGSISGEAIGTGFLTYWIVVERGGKTITFPGGFEGHAGDWDYYHNQQWQVKIVDKNAPIELFNAANDLSNISYAFQFWNSAGNLNTMSTGSPGEMAVELTTKERPADLQALGWKTYVGDNLDGRVNNINLSDKLVVKAMGQGGVPVKAIVVEKSGSSFSAVFNTNEDFREYELPFSSFQPDSMMLLPRPYPIFLPLWFQSQRNTKLNPAEIEEIQFVVPDEAIKNSDMEQGFAIESAWIQQESN